MSLSPELRELALLYPLQLSYRDIRGARQRASKDAILSMLRALGAPLASEADVPDALRERRAEICARGVDPVAVVWGSSALEITIRVPASSDEGRERFLLTLESGESREIIPERRHPIRRAEAAGRSWDDVRITFPNAALPPGYHHLSVERPGFHGEILVLAAPEKAWTPSRTERSWGVFAPLYGLRSERDWGAGDLTDLAALMRATTSLGGAGVATLPLLACFLTEPFEASPYAPVSRLFWNELFLDPLRIPEYATTTQARDLVESGAFQAERKRLRDEPLVDYRGVMGLKRKVLDLLAAAFWSGASPERRAGMDEFLAEHPRAEAYARFRAATENGRWPERPPDGTALPLEGEREESARRTHLFAQWQLERQLESLAGTARSSGFGLYLDFPLGVHGGGFDVWMERDTFPRGVAAGAPPDPFFQGGQNWGFPPMSPEGLRNSGYRYLIDALRTQMAFSGVLRFDHVMGLHRLYCIPEGRPATEGMYVRYEADETFAILAIESHRHRTRIVGEDLGVVPEIVRRRMRRHAVRRMYVLQYEIGPGGWLNKPAPEMVASLNTHDMPPFAGFFRGHDIEERERHGHVDDPEEQAAERQRTTRALGEFLGLRGLLPAETNDGQAVFEASLEWIGRSDAEIALVNVEDLWQTTEAQNLPGTHLEHPNWRRKLARPVEELVADPELTGILRRLDDWRRRGRLG